MTKEITTTIKVRGVYFHEGKNLLQSKSINIGNKVLLQHTPENPYDSNAIEVILSKNKTKLGHLPKEIAAKYVELLSNDCIKSAQISSLKSSDNGIYIKIKYSQNESSSLNTSTNTKPVEASKRKYQSTKILRSNSSENPAFNKVNLNTDSSKNNDKAKVFIWIIVIWLVIILLKS
jgi:ATP-dependent Zn protease